MEKYFARTISFIFHPLLVPTYVIALLLYQQAFFAIMIPPDVKWRIVALVFISSAVFPVMVLLGMYRLGLIPGLMMEERATRFYPYLTSTIFFSLSFYLTWQIQLSSVYYYCLLGAAILSLLSLIINLYWKISAHMVSMGAVVGFFVALHLLLHIDFFWLISTGILLAGLVAYARLRAGTHTQAQVYAGFFTGFLLMLLLVLY
jgi:hypothetical protein